MSWRRLWAMMLKEFIQLSRDRLTFAMMVGIPIMQLLMFGYAINTDPKHLNTALVVYDQGTLTRNLVQALQNSGYFQIVNNDANAQVAAEMLAKGEAQFVLTIPANFERDLVRGNYPSLLLEADAADPAATGNAIASLQQIAQAAFQHDFTGPFSYLATAANSFELRIHRLYNPEGITQYNIVPGLMGVILTMTMIMMTALGITREVEQGTMENLLATPIKPLEVMIGKIAPYILIGYVQVAVILAMARILFNVPFVGSLGLLLFSVMVFIFANLTIGITISSTVRNQTQAMQMSFFFLLPSILLSGFMFPFSGMPHWAQMIGEILPNTHFLRLVRGIMLKGNGWHEALPHLLPLSFFILVVMLIGIKKFRKTLD
ncbi:MAG TPA: ABC transporter permease [Thiolinea sp.]|nr:ABC transporter permease [Thiolinea sp.]